MKTLDARTRFQTGWLAALRFGRQERSAAHPAGAVDLESHGTPDDRNLAGKPLDWPRASGRYCRFHPFPLPRRSIVMKKALIMGTLGAALALAASPVFASWSDTAATNLAVGFGSGDQVQPKILPTSDGGCWISWFDNSTGGYDVRIQRLDSVGNAMLGPNGVLVADRYFSSTQDYGMGMDADGNALLAFRISDPNEENVQIEAQKISPDGALLWGADGIRFGNTADFLADPKITATSDGDVVVGWTDNSDMVFARLDANGNELWDPEVVISDPNGNGLTLSDLHGAEAGSAIFSYVSASGFSGPKHLLAQKLDPSGASEWTTAVYDGGSLQFGNFPTFIPDGTGGAVFAWYDSGTLASHVQHLNADGSEVFPHNGVLVSTNSSDAQVSPSAAYDGATGDIFAFWTEEDQLTQGNRGVYGQKIDASGNRDWGDDGVAVVNLGTGADYLTSTVATSDDGAIVFYAGGFGFGEDQLYAARFDTNGNLVWNPGIVDLSSTPTVKFRLNSTMTASGMAIVTWGDSATGDSNILAQNVNGDGSLGATCPTGYESFSGSVAPGERGTSDGYFAPAGIENGILISPPGFRLFALTKLQGEAQLIGSDYSNELHHWGPAGPYKWIAQAWAGSAGGNYTLCVDHP
ncbi:MAG TPA: hypothetical protein VFX03_14480 [Thermomicrobiales bacterium]|nr:hypothetical protein [Thermomicrobiales bacterium]